MAQPHGTPRATPSLVAAAARRAGVSAKKGGTTWTRLATLAPNTTTFLETVTSGTWLYRVQAFRAGGIVSAYSNQVTVRVR